MITKRTITGTILVLTAAIWIAWDIVVFVDPARGDTESELIAEYGMKLFSLPMIFGVLCGHFFILRDGVKPKPKILLPVAGVVIMLDVLAWTCVPQIRMAHEWSWAWLLIGIPVGALLWPQSKSDKI